MKIVHYLSILRVIRGQPPKKNTYWVRVRIGFNLQDVGFERLVFEQGSDDKDVILLVRFAGLLILVEVTKVLDDDVFAEDRVSTLHNPLSQCLQSMPTHTYIRKALQTAVM